MAKPNTNLSGRSEIKEDVLRQRRDLYAISFALIVFYAAGGDFGKDATFSFVPLHVERPWVLLVAAWIAFFYWLGRYRLFAPRPVLKMYREDAYAQARGTKAFRTLCAALCPIPSEVPAAAEVQRGNLLPMLDRTKDGRGFILDFRTLHPLEYNNSTTTAIRGDVVAVESGQEKHFRRMLRIGYVRAITHERTFSDYLLPYLVAWLALAVGAIDGLRRLWGVFF